MRHLHVWPSWLQDEDMSRWVEMLRRARRRREERALCVCFENPSNQQRQGNICPRGRSGWLWGSPSELRVVARREERPHVAPLRQGMNLNASVDKKKKTEQTSLKVDWTQIKRTYELEDNTSPSDGAPSDDVITSDSALADALCALAFVSSPPVLFPSVYADFKALKTFRQRWDWSAAALAADMDNRLGASQTITTEIEPILTRPKTLCMRACIEWNKTLESSNADDKKMTPFVAVMNISNVAVLCRSRCQIDDVFIAPFPSR